MIKFRIIEGETTEEKRKYEQFKKYYLENQQPLYELKNKLDINQHKVIQWSKKVRMETGFTRKDFRKNRFKKNNRSNLLKNYDKYKFYSRVLNGKKEYFQVAKNIKNKKVYYGIYSTEEEAKKIVKYLKKHDWDKESLKLIGKTVRKPTYYYKNKQNYFAVQKMINGKTIYYGRYSTEEEAKEVVEWLKKHNWSKESLKEFNERKNKRF